MDAVFRHYIEYAVEDAVPVSDVAASLIANERLLRQVVPALEELFPGLKVEPKRITLPALSQASPLKELFAFAVVLTFQEDLKKEVPDLISEMIGIEISDKYDTLLTVLVMILAIWGISKAFDKLFPGRRKEHLDEERHRLINVAGDLIQVPPERIAEAVEGVAKGQRARSITVAAQKFFTPARRPGGAEVRSHSPDVSIRREAVSEAQSAIGVSIDEEPVVGELPPASDFEFNVEIVLHAMDKDRIKQGWAGHIPGLIEERVPMRVDKTIPPQTLFGRQVIRGDIFVVYDVDEEGNRKAREFVLLRLT